MKTFAAPFGLHRTVLLLASTHFLVDGYGNILAPLLPLLITNLQSVARRRRHAADVLPAGQLGGAARLRPHRRPVAAARAAARRSAAGVSDAAADRPRAERWMLAAVLILGGLGGAAFHPPAAALVHRVRGRTRGLAMSFHITSGTLGQAMAPLLFAPFVQRLRTAGDAVADDARRSSLLGASCCGASRAIERLQERTARRRLPGAAPVRAGR